jgi:hypothetical protein
MRLFKAFWTRGIYLIINLASESGAGLSKLSSAIECDGSNFAAKNAIRLSENHFLGK